jgi:methyl-accepting chemotaxis protein
MPRFSQRARQWLAQARSVRIRLAAGFGCVLLLLGAVAWTGLRGLEGVAREAEAAARAGEVANAVARGTAEFAAARSAIRDYLLTNDEAHFDAARQAVAEARATFAAAAGEAGPDQRAEIQAVTDAIAEWLEFGELMRTVWVSYTEAVEQDLFPLATTLTAALRQVTDAHPEDLQIKRAALRFNEGRAIANRFMYRGDADTVPAAQAALADARDLLLEAAGRSYTDSADADTWRNIADRIGDYARTHEEMAARRADADLVRNDQLIAAGSRAAEQTDQLVAEIAALARQARASAAEGAEETRRYGLALAGIAALVGFALAYLLGRSVVNPLARLRGSVEAIAAGDTARPVPDQARADEAGDIARALERLRLAAEGAFAQQQMVEQLPIGVMTLDPAAWRIAYANPETREIFARIGLLAEGDAGLLPRAESLRPVIADPARLPHRERIRLGEEVLDLAASPIRDRGGAYTAAMLCWTVSTAQSRLADSFERDVGGVVGGVAGSAATVETAAADLARLAELSGRLATEVGEAGTAAGAEVQAVAASAEELAASVAEITRQVTSGAGIARAAAQEARAADGTVQGLAEAAARIGDVVRLISDIAGRTNLLALNATIEAAPAGEAGKGFAVVASEVKQLAAQTAKATEEVGQQIAGVQQATEKAVGALRRIGGRVSEIEEVTAAIASAVEQQGAATREIAATAARVADATTRVMAGVAEVRGAAGETGGSATSLVDAASDLSRQAETLRDRSGGFLLAVRAA